MQLIVEFLGPSRRLAQTKQTALEVAEPATFRDVLRQVATHHPALLDAVIDSSTYELAPEFMLNINGRRVVSDLDTIAQEGQHLIIMVMEAGG